MQASRLTAMAECVASAAGARSRGKRLRGRDAHGVDPVPELGLGIVARLALGLVGHQQLEHHLARLLGPLASPSSPSCRRRPSAGRRRPARARPRPRPCRRGSCRRRDSRAPDASTGAGSWCRCRCGDLPDGLAGLGLDLASVQREGDLGHDGASQLFSSISTKAILEGVGVDDVVVHAGLAEVGDALLQLGEALLALRARRASAGRCPSGTTT